MKGGEGQGKTSSLPYWLFQSSTLLKSLEEQCTGLYLTSIDKQYVSQQVAEGYVDDCDAGTADQCTQQTNTPEIITERMRDIAQTWADLIYGSGGEWNWKEGKASLALVTEVDAQIQLINRQTGVTATLKRREPSDAIWQLGLENDLLGGQKSDYSRRYSTIVKMSYRIKKNFISPKNAWQIYQNVWLPAGQYPLACTTWSKKECEKLMSPFLNAILPKLGLNHHFPQVGYLSIKYLLGHLRENSLTGQH
eukprot:2044527-Ditylum_brightwellii.AAC.1